MARPSSTSPKALASLFDAASHLEPVLPLELLEAWAVSEKTTEVAESLMNEFYVRGTCMLGDASGLSKMSRELPLADVLALLHVPKSLVMHVGSHFGGEAVHGWVADNTAFWFPEEIPASSVLECAEVLQSSFSVLPFKMSLGLHSGGFYKIGNTLVGPSFSHLEHIAENDVLAGQIWITKDLANIVNIVNKPLEVVYQGEYDMCSWPVAQRPAVHMGDTHVPYPHGFDQDFFMKLDAYARSKSASGLKSLEAHATRSGYIIFFAYDLTEGYGLEGMLEQQLQDTLLGASLAEVPLPGGADWVKVGGGIGILRSDTNKGALEAVKRLYTVFVERGILVSFGVDFGMYFFFQQEDGGRDVAGSPVNIASKLSEDAGECGCVLMTEAAWDGETSGERKVIAVSGIQIPAIQIALEV